MDLKFAMVLESRRQHHLIDHFIWQALGMNPKQAKGAALAEVDMVQVLEKVSWWECVYFQVAGESACSGCESRGNIRECRGARVIKNHVNALGERCPLVGDEISKEAAR